MPMKNQKLVISPWRTTLFLNKTRHGSYTWESPHFSQLAIEKKFSLAAAKSWSENAAYKWSESIFF